MLEEMERDFGISCSVGMPKDQNLNDLLDLEKHESVLRNNTPSHNEELRKAPSNIYSLEDEKNKVGKMFLSCFIALTLQFLESE